VESNKIKIWLADDSPVYRTLITQELRMGLGAEVKTFPDGDSLIAAYAKNSPPDLILLDFHFDFDDHENNGSRTLRKLREMGVQTPAVLVTGVSEPEFVAERKQEDFIDVIDKFHDDMIGHLKEIISSIGKK